MPPTISGKQCAAERIHSELMRAPPQNTSANNVSSSSGSSSSFMNATCFCNNLICKFQCLKMGATIDGHLPCVLVKARLLASNDPLVLRQLLSHVDLQHLGPKSIKNIDLQHRSLIIIIILIFSTVLFPEFDDLPDLSSSLPGNWYFTDLI